MSIVAYVGRPGSGKSYGVVENVILPAFRKSRIVCTNIPMKLEALVEAFGEGEYQLIQFGPEDYDTEGWWSGLPAGAVVVLDEVWRAFPAGTTQDKMPQERREFLAEHRHQVGADGYSTEIVLVTQDLKQIAASVRPLIDKVYVAEKLDAVGSTKRYRVDIYQGSDTKKDRFIRSVYGSYKPEIYRFYLSHTKSENAVAGIEERPDNRSVIWKNAWLMLGLPGSILALVAVVWWFASYQDRVNAKAAKAEAARLEAEARNRPTLTDDPFPKSGEAVAVDKGPELIKAPAPPPPPPPPQVSAKWRIVGVMTMPDAEPVVYLQGGAKMRKRKVPMSWCTGELDLECKVDGELVYRWSGPARQSTALAGMSDTTVVAAGQSLLNK